MYIYVKGYGDIMDKDDRCNGVFNSLESEAIQVFKKVRKLKSLILFFLSIFVLINCFFSLFLFLSETSIKFVFIILLSLFGILILITTILYIFTKAKYKKIAKKNPLNNKKEDIIPKMKLISNLITNNDEKIGKILDKCYEDPKAFYSENMDKISPFNPNLIDIDSYLIADVMCILENNNYLSIVSENCDNIEFRKQIVRLDKTINFENFDFKNQNTDVLNIDNWINNINKVILKDDKALMLFDLSNIFSNKVILFIISLNQLKNFVTIPGMNYLFGYELLKNNPEKLKEYDIALLIQKYYDIDNYIKTRCEELKKFNEAYMNELKNCKSWEDAYKLEAILNDDLK